MRIGIDMLGVQSPHSRGRGIGRFAGNLVSALLRVDARNQYVLYTYDDLPTDDFPRAPNAELVKLAPLSTAAQSISQTLHANPDRLDALLLLSPFELYRGYEPPDRPLNGPVLAAVVHDLIPFLFQERYLTWPPFAAKFYRNLERLRRYDSLLANSEFTRLDCLRILGSAPDRVSAILGASDPEFFVPVAPGTDSAEANALLQRLGIDRPFVFCLGSMDERKNLVGLIDAFGLLPGRLRDLHQLVLTFGIRDDEAQTLRKHARSRGIEENQLILTGSLPDEGIRVLYQRCAAFAHPSHYEGLGLPLLEAMLCGAPVLGGNNSSQIEVIAEAGLLVNSGDSTDIAEKLGLLLSNHALADRFRHEGREQAKRFRWEGSAERTIAAIGAAVERQRHRKSRRLRIDLPVARRPRLAFFSPLPPKRSGIADYAIRLIGELSHHYEIDLYHDPGYIPQIGLSTPGFRCLDARLFERNARSLGYRGIRYQMGNSTYHRWIYETMLAHPGVVTLHDYNLAGFHHWYASHASDDPNHLAHEICHSEGPRASRILDRCDRWSREPGGLPEALARREIALNRRVFERSKAVVLHSPTFQQRATFDYPEFVDRVRLIPLGADPAPSDAASRAEARARFGLPIEGFVIGSFGILHPTKMNVETLQAFARVSAARPDLTLIFVGRDLSLEPVRERTAALGLDHRVRFFGHLPAEDYDTILSAIDLGISLRRPPTNGETSAALLDLLRRGVPTIVTNTGSFADFPENVVRKVHWERDGLDGLTAAIQEMTEHAHSRASLSEQALRHVAEIHSWKRVASLYAQLLDEQAQINPMDDSHAYVRACAGGTGT